MELLPDFISLALSYIVKTQKEKQAAPFVDDNSSNSWSYAPVKTKEEFLNWLSSFEMPFEDFDYDEDYKSIHDDIGTIFGFMENWEQDYQSLLEKYAIEHGQDLLSRLSENDKNSLIEYYDWDGKSWEGVLFNVGEISLGSEFGGIASNLFIQNFTNLSLKRKVFELFIVSLIRWNLWDIFPNAEDQPQTWFDYEINPINNSTW